MAQDPPMVMRAAVLQHTHVCPRPCLPYPNLRQLQTNFQIVRVPVDCMCAMLCKKVSLGQGKAGMGAVCSSPQAQEYPRLQGWHVLAAKFYWLGT